MNDGDGQAAQRLKRLDIGVRVRMVSIVDQRAVIDDVAGEEDTRRPLEQADTTRRVSGVWTTSKRRSPRSTTSCSARDAGPVPGKSGSARLTSLPGTGRTSHPWHTVGEGPFVARIGQNGRFSAVDAALAELVVAADMVEMGVADPSALLLFTFHVVAIAAILNSGLPLRARSGRSQRARRTGQIDPERTCRGRDRDFSLPPRTDPGVRLSRTGLLPEVGRDRASAEVAPQRRSAGRRRVQDAWSGSAPGASPVVCHPSDRAPFPPRPPPPLIAALFGRFAGTTRLVRLLACSTAASAPRLPAAARDRHSDCGPDEVSQVPTRSFRA